MLYIFPKFLLSSKECSISNYTPIWVQRKAIPVIITEDSVHFLKNPKKSPQSQFLFTKIKKKKKKKPNGFLFLVLILCLLVAFLFGSTGVRMWGFSVCVECGSLTVQCVELGL